MNIAPSYTKFVYPYMKGRIVGTSKHMKETSANKRKDVIDEDSSGTRRRHIAKFVRALR